MAFAHEVAVTGTHGLEHVVIYGIVIVALTVVIKLLWRI